MLVMSQLKPEDFIPTTEKVKKIYLPSRCKPLLSKSAHNVKALHCGRSAGFSMTLDSWETISKSKLQGYVLTFDEVKFVGLDTIVDKEDAETLSNIPLRYIVDLKQRTGIHVLSVCTDNASNCALTRRLLCGRFKCMIGSPCFAHQTHKVYHSFVRERNNTA